jgi:HPt (histidine-containing phosphotransfer) domain-containing protein
MTSGEVRSSNTTWDRADVLNRVDNDRELLHELLGMFKEDFPSTFAALKSAVQSADLKASSALSHKLKGMLSNLGGVAAAAAASRIESLASAKDGNSLPDALAALERESQDLIHELDAYLAEVQG